MNKFNKLIKDDRGVASIIIVIVVMFILSLLVLGMAQNAQKEQRQALDRQLSSSAFYAAEAGINDTINFIRDPTKSSPNRKTECANISGFPSNNLSSDTEATIQYSCVLYEKLPASIEFEEVGLAHSKIVPIAPVNEDGVPRALRELTIQWEEKNGDRNVSSCNMPSGGALPPKSGFPSPCSAGMLRVQLMDVHTGGTTFNRDRLFNYNSVDFFTPGTAAVGPVTFPQRNASFNGHSSQGNIIQGHCSNSNEPRRCKLSYAFGPGQFPTGAVMFMQLRSIYKSNTVTITGVDDRGRSVRFKNAQIMVDATGKANDVLRRIQVRIPVRPDTAHPEAALQTRENLCKLLNVYPKQGGPPDYGAIESPCVH